MKNLFKFTAAAVALFSFASCSNDLIDLNGNSTDFTAANELKIEAEEMDGGNLASGTRSAYVGTTNARVWQETDVFKVYGPEVIGKYDYYKYSKANNKFVIEGDKDLETAAFVGFPKDRVVGQDWTKESNAAFLDFYIPSKLENYGEIAGSDPTAFVSNLPLWGTAENDGDGIKAKVYFLTAIIKVGLSNLKGNAQRIRVIAYKDVAGTEDPATINGVSRVQLSNNGEVYAASDVQLGTPTYQGEEKETYAKNVVCMHINADDVNAQKSVVYLPLIAGTYGNVKVQYSVYAEGNEWVDINEYKNKEFKRATCYGKGNEWTFNVKATSIKTLNGQLAGMASTASGEVVVKCDNDIIVNTDAGNSELKIPAMPSVTKLTLNFNTNQSFKAYTDLVISGDFAGTFVLASDASNHAVDEAGAATSLEIKLPNAAVVLGQRFNNNKYTLTYAKEVQFGGIFKTPEGAYNEIDFTTGGAASLTVKADVGDITVFDGAKVGVVSLATDHLTTKIDVKEKAQAGDITVEYSQPSCAPTTAITVAGKAGKITVNNADAKVNNATIEVSGVAGNIVNAGTGAITIKGAPNYADPYTKVGTVSTSGDVTINLDNEGGVTTGLTFNKAAALALTQGYVGAVTVDAGAKDVVAITLGAEKYNNIGKITTTVNKGTFTINESTWNGERIGGSIDTDAEAKTATGDNAATAAGLNTVVTAWTGLSTAAGMTEAFTAIDLAEKINKATTNITLGNDINLNNKPWTPNVSNGTVGGNGHTIKNLTVKVPADGDATLENAGLGLFTTLSHDVSNLTLDGVTIAAVPYKKGGATPAVNVSNIGALAGQLTTAATISNVAVKNISLSSTNGGNTIGGVIGKNTAAAILTGVVVSGTNSIQGYGYLGGFIGNAVEAVTVTTIAKDAVLYGTTKAAAAIVSAATASFKANYNSDVQNDLTYLKVGNMIGSISADKLVSITAAEDVKPTLTNDKSIFTGTTAWQTIEAGQTKSYEIVNDKQTLIGFCGFGGTATVPATPFLSNTNAPSLNGKQFGVYVTKEATEGLPLNAQNWLYYINK